MSLRRHGRLSEILNHAFSPTSSFCWWSRFHTSTRLNLITNASICRDQLSFSAASSYQHRGISQTRLLASATDTRTILDETDTDSSQLQKWTSKNSTDTIFALSTPPGHSAVAIIRISGPACKHVYASFCPGKDLPKPRYASVRALYDPKPVAEPFHPIPKLRHSSVILLNDNKPGAEASGPERSKEESGTSATPEMIDPAALVLYFPGPRTITGEDVVEFHVHGGQAVIQSVLRGIPQCAEQTPHSRIRPAEPGEFTRRAFLSGRIDLPQAEALGNLLAAETEQQRRLATRGTQGAAGRQYMEWREKLIEARGELEALIDFAEDQQFEESPKELYANVRRQVQALQELVLLSTRNAVRGELLRKGIQVFLVGSPNAGKSSLLNLIAGREAALVHWGPGTTRDVIEVLTDINGWAVRLCDGAGLRSQETPKSPRVDGQRRHRIHPVEMSGMMRAMDTALASDMVVYVLEVEPHSGGEWDIKIMPQVMEHISRCAKAKIEFMIVVNKIDIIRTDVNPTNQFSITKAKEIIYRQIDKFRKQSKNKSFEALDIPIVGISCYHARFRHSKAKTNGNIHVLLDTMSIMFRNMTSVLQPPQQNSVPQGPQQSEDSSQFLVDNSFWQESVGATERQRFLLKQCATELAHFLCEVNSYGDGEAEPDIVLAAERLRKAADCLASVTGKGGSGDVEEILGVIFSK